MSEQKYTVRGHWPFPLDMLRRDDAHAATEADSNLIRSLSATHIPSDISSHREYAVGLVRSPPHKWDAPNFDRWKSFGWTVMPESLPENLRPMRYEHEPNIRNIKTVAEAEERRKQVGVRAESDPEAATSMERYFHRDVLYTIANGLTDDPQGVANVAFETWRLDFPRW